LEPPLTINNGPMASVSELLRIKGMTPILYQRLLPHIVALDISIGLNINTANLTVLRSINVGNNGEPLSLDDAQMLLSDIQSDVPETADDFKGMPNMSSLYGSTGSGANSAVNIDTSGLAFKSDYFILNGTLLVGDHVERSKSLISRSESNAKVIRRTDANF
ncbi:MAG: general secretion pathway protein K, partial [Flavobacteriales bacterium]